MSDICIKSRGSVTYIQEPLFPKQYNFTLRKLVTTTEYKKSQKQIKVFNNSTRFLE